ncbi:MAG: hypothetical protein ACJ76J_19415 [Thermoanaerobaculia bacterium]
MTKKRKSSSKEKWTEALAELASYSLEEVNTLLKAVGATGSVDAALGAEASRLLPTSHTDYHGDNHSDFHGDNHGDQHFDAAVLPEATLED